MLECFLFVFIRTIFCQIIRFIIYLKKNLGFVGSVIPLLLRTFSATYIRQNGIDFALLDVWEAYLSEIDSVYNKLRVHLYWGESNVPWNGYIHFPLVCLH